MTFYYQGLWFEGLGDGGIKLSVGQNATENAVEVRNVVIPADVVGDILSACLPPIEVSEEVEDDVKKKDGKDEA